MTIWSWKSPVDCTTLESNVETLIRDNVYWKSFLAFFRSAYGRFETRPTELVANLRLSDNFPPHTRAGL